MATNERDKIIKEERRKMTSLRREVDGVFKHYQDIVRGRLGVISRQAHQVYEDAEDGSKGDPEEIQAKMEAKVNEMIQLKVELEDHLKSLDTEDAAKLTKDLDSKGKERSQSLIKQWEETDKELETILENAAIDDKGSDFDRLPEKLRMCLLCLSIFPFGAEIEKRVLIYWWTGEGFVTRTQEKTAVEVGEDTLNDLLEGEFIQPVYNRRSGVIVKCRMHPWIHWMLISKAKEAKFFDFDETGMPSSSPSKENRVCLISKSEGRIEEDQQKPNEKLITLFNLDVKYLDFDIESFSRMKNIVVLQLGRWIASPGHHIEMKPEILERLSKLTNLKYLSLRGISVIETLPKSIQKLRHLTVLDLRGCQNLKQLTDGITKLVNLTHLDVSECYMLENMPKGLSSMSGLQVLKGFVISNSAKAGKIADLSNLPELKKLSIIIGSQVKKARRQLQDLGSIRGLCSLTIIWSDLPETIPGYTKHDVASLKIPPKIEKLDLRCYASSEMPKWFNPKDLQNLKRLYIRGGKLESLNLKEQKKDDEKWKIEVLRLRFLPKLNTEWTNIVHLESLQHLEFSNCDLQKNGEQPKLDKDGVWTKIEDTEATTSHPTPTTSDADSSAPQPAHITTPEPPPQPTIPGSDATAPQTHDATAPTAPPASTTTILPPSPSTTAPSPPAATTSQPPTTSDVNSFVPKPPHITTPEPSPQLAIPGSDASAPQTHDATTPTAPATTTTIPPSPSTTTPSPPAATTSQSPATSDVDSSIPQTAHITPPKPPPQLALPSSDATAPQPQVATTPTAPATTTTIPPPSPSTTTPSPPAATTSQSPATSDVDSSVPQPAHITTPETPSQLAVPGSDPSATQTRDTTAPTLPPATATTTSSAPPPETTTTTPKSSAPSS